MFGTIFNADGDLFDRFERLHRDMEDVLGYRNGPSSIRSVARGGYPAINVGTSANGVDVYVFAAGLDMETIDLSIQQNLLTIAGNCETAAHEGDKVYLRERFRGQFRRSVSLPDDIDADSAQASYRNGVLHISLARKAEAQPRKIQVN
jgi:HSP20 family protein